jgi:hypothetical protein
MFVELCGYCGDRDGETFSPTAGFGDGVKFWERGGKRGNSLRTFPASLTSLIQINKWGQDFFTSPKIEVERDSIFETKLR